MADVTDATFEAEVLARSEQVPVIIDLWAEWCGPCKTLGPMLEAAVAARAGAVELAKVDVDQNPGIAQAFAVQSIPAVFALSKGKIIDSFVGAVGAEELEAFFERVLEDAAPTPADLAIDAGDETSLRAALEGEPGHEGAILTLAALLVSTDRPTEAISFLERLPEIPAVRHLLAEARLAEQAVDVKNQEMAPLLDELLTKVRTDDAARQEYLDLLETLGPNSEVASTYRKKLATALF